MTRFARAKGAAASNERVEEEATPWHQMVRGIRSANGFKAGRGNRDVEDLDGDMEVLDTDDSLDDSSKQHKTAVEATYEGSNSSDDDGDYEIENEIVENTVKEPFKKQEPTIVEESNDSGTKKKRQRKQNKCLNCKKQGHLKRDCPDLPEERRKELQELVEMKIERKGKGTGRKKNKKRKNPEENENGENGVVSHADKRQKTEEPSGTLKTHKSQNENKPASRNIDGNNDYQKKMLKDKTGQVVGDGEGLFQGFRVKEQDVKRLQKLQKELKSDKTLKDEDINATLKRERRRAERGLANFHKIVCFNCRKSGHLLVDCPDTVAQQDKNSQTDVKPNSHCFKCGDKNHTSRECVSKLKGADAFRFAVCFICKETGHLAKSCPDNPKGMYPKGGGCRFCGSVEHLKSDCTRKAEKDKRQEVTLNTISMRHKNLGIEEVEGPALKSKNKVPEKKAKTVAF